MMPRPLVQCGLTALLLLTLAACQQQAVESGDDATGDEAPAATDNAADADTGTRGEAEENTMSENPNQPLELDAAIEAARLDLAERSGVKAAQIEVEDARSVTWRNGAMGCPEEGMMYTQALVPGYYILLRADDRRHAYHAGRDGQPFLCPQDRSQKPPPSEELPEA